MYKYIQQKYNTNLPRSYLGHKAGNRAIPVFERSKPARSILFFANHKMPTWWAEEHCWLLQQAHVELNKNGDPYCTLCGKQATRAHIESNKHQWASCWKAPTQTAPVPHAAAAVLAAPGPGHAAPVHAAPAHAAPVHDAPVLAAPVHAAPVHAAPVRADAPVHAAPVHGAAPGLARAAPVNGDAPGNATAALHGMATPAASAPDLAAAWEHGFQKGMGKGFMKGWLKGSACDGPCDQQ